MSCLLASFLGFVLFIRFVVYIGGGLLLSGEHHPDHQGEGAEVNNNRDDHVGDVFIVGGEAGELLAVNNPIGVVFTGIFMAMLDIVGQNLTGFTAYNEYITDVIIAVIVYLSAFSLVIRMWLNGRKKKVTATPADAQPIADNTQKGGDAQ